MAVASLAPAIAGVRRGGAAPNAGATLSRVRCRRPQNGTNNQICASFASLPTAHAPLTAWPTDAANSIMGPCQGRVCGLIVGAGITRTRGVPIAEIGNYRPRAPHRPIILSTRAAVAAGPNQIAKDSFA
jgi:hypothetical protein